MHTTQTAPSLLLVPSSRGTRAYPTAPVRVTSMWGQGFLSYLTDDGYAAVLIDGETRLDEYPADMVKIIR